MNLAVVLPSRGLIYSKTVEELYCELGAINAPFRVLFSHGRPIPDCFNIPTEQALEGGYTHVLFVEEDMILPEGILSRMIARDAQAITCDYPLSHGSSGTVLYDQEGRALFTGCGLLLVTTELLRRMPKPIWRTDIKWELAADDGLVYFRGSQKTDPTVYGQQDVAFGLRLYANGMPIEIMDETIGQRELITRGGRVSNAGFHTIEERTEVIKRRDLEHRPKLASFREIIVDGKPVKIKPDYLKTLTNVEYPDRIQCLSAVFDVTPELKAWLLLETT